MFISIITIKKRNEIEIVQIKFIVMKICLIYNYAQQYRTDIFSLLDKEMGVDFYFGDKMADVKKMDYSLLKNFKSELKKH